MQLKTVEERARTLGHKVIAAIKQFQEERPRRQTLWLDHVIIDEFTQDRAEIRAVLKAALDQLEAPMSNDPYYDSYSGYGRAISDAISVIDTLLPGDVSK